MSIIVSEERRGTKVSHRNERNERKLHSQGNIEK
nr:MAG TPA: hypothetical protein [Caudoviricetes sp.]